jgi:hypothetical protein
MKENEERSLGCRGCRTANTSKQGECAVAEAGTFQEMQAAVDMRRAQMHDRVARGVIGALDDIHRRVIEEPWFGRTIHDVVNHINGRMQEEMFQGQGQGQDTAHQAAQQTPQMETPGGNEPSPQAQSSVMDAFYGRDGQTQTQAGQEVTSAENTPARQESSIMDTFYSRDQGQTGLTEETQERDMQQEMER